MKELKPGLEGVSRTVVRGDNTALDIGSGDMAVFATPAMIAVMENAALLAVEEAVGKGMTTVGTHISVSHSKATPLGGTVRAKAVLTEVDGRRLVFSVSAADGSGETIGEGTHERVIVNREKFLAKLY